MISSWTKETGELIKWQCSPKHGGVSIEVFERCLYWMALSRPVYEWYVSKLVLLLFLYFRTLFAIDNLDFLPMSEYSIRNLKSSCFRLR